MAKIGCKITQKFTITTSPKILNHVKFNLIDELFPQLTYTERATYM